jgi:hypothetical protein
MFRICGTVQISGNDHKNRNLIQEEIKEEIELG